MSDDLISRKAVMSHVESEHRQWGEDYDAEQILGDIEDFPIAYNADEIIEKLKELKTYKLNMADAMSEIMRRGELGTYVCLEDVLEIIKSGGVSDD